MTALNAFEFSWRSMRGEDLPGVLRIERNAQQVPWGRLAFEESVLRSERNGGEPYYCRVVIIEGESLRTDQIIGFHIISKIMDELHILNVAVAPNFQGKGFGHVLLNDIVDLAKGHDIAKIFLEVRASNRVAQSLYRKWGFEQISVRKNYYRLPKQGREDALVFVRQLRKTVSV